MGEVKMSDVFELPVTAYTSRVKLNIGFSVNCLNIECAHGRDCDGENHAQSAAHAINNHDRLQQENAGLREMLNSVVELQAKHYGCGMNTHLAMMTKAKEIKDLLNKND